LKRVREYSGGTVLALVAAFVLVSFVSGCFEGLSSSSPGDPSSAGVIDWNVFWSPDSRSIAFTRSDYGPPGDTPSGASDVFVASADGRELRRLTRTPYDETVLGWLWNPPRIVYASYESPNGPTIVYALELKGGGRVMLGEVRAADQIVALSHDARRALVTTPRSEPRRYALLDLVGNTRRPLPGMADYWWLDGAWSRDDSMLAYVTDESIVILRGDRVLRRIPLGTDESASGGLAWSPDARRLAYGEGGLGSSSLWRVRIEDGSRSRLVGGGDNNVYPVWSPDGSTIYYERGSFGGDDGLRAIAPDGTGDRKITDDDWAGGGWFDFEGKNDRWLEQARISPDGTKIAYLLGQRGAWKNWSLLGVMNADGSDKTPVPGSD
jgi:Tol biopolymer transport system component